MEVGAQVLTLHVPSAIVGMVYAKLGVPGSKRVWPSALDNQDSTVSFAHVTLPSFMRPTVFSITAVA
jgi:hypothetical protein